MEAVVPEVPEEFEWILELRSRGGKTKAQARKVDFSVITRCNIDTIVGGQGSGSFKGELKDSVPHGEGIWTGVVTDAKGIWTGDFNGEYKGEWEDGLPHGQGRFTKKSIDEFSVDENALVDDGYYEGEFQDGAMQGYGTLKYTKGILENTVYEGDMFDDNYVEGQGRCDFSFSGCSYAGEFSHSYLSHISGNGVYYRYNQLCNGKDAFTYADSSKFEGKFRDGKMYGAGKVTYRNGNVLEGEFVDGRYEGFGCLKEKKISEQTISDILQVYIKGGSLMQSTIE